MDLNQARTIYQGIQDSKLTNLADELVRAAVRYARLRTDWALSTTERRL